MTPENPWLWELDGWIVAAGVLCAVAASLVGNFLVLRRASMLGDAISHAVLPGLAVAFLITGSRQNLPMFLGAVAVGVFTAVMTQWIRDLGRVDEGASMGVVFTTLFALGLILIVRAADYVDLDPDCVLYGAIELTPIDTVGIGDWEVPRVVIMLGIVTLLNLLFLIAFFKELRLTSFDPEMAESLGFGTRRVHYALMTMVAITAVASFESVGNILVVAMLVVPPATARLLTDRLVTMVVLSTVIAAASAVFGHLGAITVPRWFGYAGTTTAGMMAAATGVGFAAALLLSPRQGLVFELLRRRRNANEILRDDLLAFLFRREEQGADSVPLLAIRRSLNAGKSRVRRLLWSRQVSGHIRKVGTGYRLTERGRRLAAEVIRAHRLWEQYLVDRAGVASHRSHGQAERLEHFSDRTVRDELDRQTEFPVADPHGRPIPEEQDKDHGSAER